MCAHDLRLRSVIQLFTPILCSIYSAGLETRLWSSSCPGLSCQALPRYSARHPLTLAWPRRPTRERPRPQTPELRPPSQRGSRLATTGLTMGVDTSSIKTRSEPAAPDPGARIIEAGL